MKAEKSNGTDGKSAATPSRAENAAQQHHAHSNPGKEEKLDLAPSEASKRLIAAQAAVNPVMEAYLKDSDDWPQHFISCGGSMQVDPLGTMQVRPGAQIAKEPKENGPSEDQPAPTGSKPGDKPAQDRLEAVPKRRASTSTDGFPENSSTEAGTSQRGTA